MKDIRNLPPGPNNKKKKQDNQSKFSPIGAFFFLASAFLVTHYVAIPLYEKIKNADTSPSSTELENDVPLHDDLNNEHASTEKLENMTESSFLKMNLLKISGISIPNYTINPFLNLLSLEYNKEKLALAEVSFAGSDARTIEDVLANVLFVDGFYSSDQLKWYKYVKPNPLFMGSGKGILLTKEGHVLLPAHVLSPELDQFSDFSTYDVSIDDSHYGRVTNILAISKKYDLALVKTDYKPKKFIPPVFRTSELLQAGLPITRLTKERDEKTKKIVIANESGIREKISSEYKNNALVYSEGLMTFDVSVYAISSKPGYSGSPLVDAGGSIVGILVGSSKEEKIAYAVNSEHVQELITGYISELQKIDGEKEKIRAAQKEKAKKNYESARKKQAKDRKEKGINKKIAESENYDGRNEYSSDFILGDTLRYYENHLTPAAPYTKKGTFDTYSPEKKGYKESYNSSFTKEQKKAEEERIKKLKMLIKGGH